ncbi:copper-binding protein [Aminobacter anthyllidis]|uniref:copper-binding protein n=1 Tax=Aminobacter anthyllidis TaxID=1035067 RepID=UPI0024552ABC|nr:copper-binding protein [Aminobacter anthyllidis]MDH4989154.1 copper-binding protein [Aminobacter anthyllidis]
MRTSLKAGLVIAALLIPAAAQAVEGEVKKINDTEGKITLKHGPIDNLGMGAMQMVFRVTDPSLLGKVKVGDKVDFEADRVNGAITVTKIEKAS